MIKIMDHEPCYAVYITQLAFEVAVTRTISVIMKSILLKRDLLSNPLATSRICRVLSYKFAKFLLLSDVILRMGRDLYFPFIVLPNTEKDPEKKTLFLVS